MSDKVFSIPETVRSTSKPVDSPLVSDAVEILQRLEAEKEDLSATTLVLDNSNKITFPGYPFKFEGLGEKILVSIDIFKSGYECKVCSGRKKIDTKCHCEKEGKPGLRYTAEEIATIRASLGDGIADARVEQKCTACLGDYPAARSTTLCPSCKGLGAVLILPDTAKNLPTTGVVVSMGIGTTDYWRDRQNKPPLNYKVGDRILFGPYAGSMIPTKAGVLFKVLEADNAWCRIEGADGMGQFDFVMQDSESL